MATSQRTSFTARTDKDTKTPQIQDVKLLPGGLAVLADLANDCVKLFTIAGQHLHSVTIDGRPNTLAIVDVTATDSWQVAVTQFNANEIAMLEVAQHGVTVKRTIPTSKNYYSIAAVDSNTFAVGYSASTGIDLIDHTGNVLRQINSAVGPRHMVSSPSQHLMITTEYDSIAKVTIRDGSAVYERKVGQVKTPRGITCTQDESCITTDCYTRSLHLVTSDGVWVKQLWAHPAGKDDHDPLFSVCVFQNMCLCCTLEGSVFVLDMS